jgi:hypothetical protein
MKKPIMKISLAFIAICCSLLGTAKVDAKQLASSIDTNKYELSSIVKSLMISESGREGFHGDYSYFKSLLKGMRPLTKKELNTQSYFQFPGNPTEYAHIYQGKIPFFLNGKGFSNPKMKKKDFWTVQVAGTKDKVSKVYLKNEDAGYGGTSGGVTYFTTSGLKLEPLSCEAIDSQNYNAVYKVTAPGKQPLLLGVSKSLGSRGLMYEYDISWHGIKSLNLNEEEIFQNCDIKD